MKSFLVLITTLTLHFPLYAQDMSCQEETEVTTNLHSFEEVSNRLIYKDLPSNCEDVNSQNYNSGNVNPLSFESYCALDAKQMLQRLCYRQGRLGQENEGGLFGLQTGVCWWHSQFHRKTNYLTFFEPDNKQKISDEDFLELVKNIDHYKVTKIPGYKSFTDMVLDPQFPNRRKILKKFLQEEMGRGSLGFEWTHGFEGKPNRAHLGKGVERQRENQLKEIDQMMKSLKNINPSKVKPVYTMVQYPFVMAHAFIIYDIESFKVDGLTNYRIRVQDSNYQDNSYGERVYVFDNKTAQWFSDSAYKELEEVRTSQKPFVIHREWTNRNPPVPAGAKKILSQQWTLHIQREKDNDKINKSFEEVCGKKLFH